MLLGLNLEGLVVCVACVHCTTLNCVVLRFMRGDPRNQAVVVMHYDGIHRYYAFLEPLVDDLIDLYIDGQEVFFK